MPVLLFVVLAALTWIASMDVGLMPQIVLSAIGIGFLLLLRKFPDNLMLKAATISVSLFITLRYITWRLLHTLPWGDAVAMTLAMILIAAELYGIWLFFAGVFMTIHPLKREITKLPDDENTWPTVDVLVPTYNEPWSVVGPTLIAARDMNYPKNKLRVICCDDGGTEQKRNQENPKAAADAMARHIEFRKLCGLYEIDYITREKNEGAKAGNLNHALTQCDGELVAVLDADHVPTADFLQKTVGPFLEDPKLFLVQTPHFFIEPDPIEKNLNTFQRMPAENDMFYQRTQPGLDWWNASFFCGSAAVLRREALNEVKGIQTSTITEDAHTSLELHSRGWNSAYIDTPLIAGLQPGTFVSFVTQRKRWAVGMTQIFLLHNPFLRRGLTTAQRLCYTASAGFWFFPFARIAFLFAPIVFLVFGLEIFRTDGASFASFSIPHLLSSLIVTDYLYGKYRWPFISELYETALSIFTAPAIVRTALAPRSPKFAVTAKDETTDKEFLSPLTRPFVFILLLLICAFLVGVWRWFAVPMQRGPISIVLGWDAFNILLILGAIGAMWEQVRREHFPRVRREASATLFIDGKTTPVDLINLSLGGALIRSRSGISRSIEGGDGKLIVTSLGREFPPLDVALRRTDWVGGHMQIGLEFLKPDIGQTRAVIDLMHGESGNWTHILEQRTVNPGLIRGVWFFLSRAVVYGAKTFWHVTAGQH